MKKFNLEKLLSTVLIVSGFLCFLSACKKDASSKATSQNAARIQAPAVIVSTIAGKIIGEPPVGGSSNGTGTAATFYQPFAIAADVNGNLYVTDNFNYLIRKITTSVVVSTFAGNGIGGYTDGPSTTAAFRLPYGITVDGSGNLYLADTYNAVIRKITPVGIMSTFAGNKAGGGGSAYTDGTGTAATFEFPWGIAADANGNLFVADKFTIRKITPAGVVTTFAGSGTKGSANGTGTSASFYGLTGIAVDLQGNVYAADAGNYLIRKITPSGIVSTLAGSGAQGFSDGTGTGASFNAPGGMTIDAKGNIYITDTALIREITPAGDVVTIAGNTTATGGQATDGTGKVATFNGPQGITIDAGGNLYVTDTDDNLIRKIVFK